MPDQAVTTVERNPYAVIVRVQPEKIDETNLRALRTEVAAAGAEAPHLPVALDLSKVGFMPSLSLSGLVQLQQLFRSRGQRLVLVGLKGGVRETFLITHLDRVFEIQNDLSMLTGGTV